MARNANRNKPPAGDILLKLSRVLNARKRADPDSSYAARLYARGLPDILKKIGEETTETIVAALDGDKPAIVHEIADLWFHTLILLAHQQLSAQHVLKELARRYGRSGLAEKAARRRPGRARINPTPAGGPA